MLRRAERASACLVDWRLAKYVVIKVTNQPVSRPQLFAYTRVKVHPLEVIIHIDLSVAHHLSILLRNFPVFARK